jgi:GMP synthase-like glutamine amidotransferase
MRIAIVENTGITHHGQLGVALHEAGLLADQFRPYAGQALPSDLAEYDALVVFGGEQSALADETHSYLPALGHLMRQAVNDHKAVLGICLGAQLMARGFGAQNLIGTAPEFGWCKVQLTPEGLADPVLSAAGAEFPIFEWHSDTFTLPQGAIRLAGSSSVPQQAFRAGRAGYATQFHFEANQAVVRDWQRRFPEAVDRMDPSFRARLHDLAADHGPKADAAGLALARAFIAQIKP